MQSDRKTQNNKGFTLVEMVVVLVLMTILLGIVSMGIIAVQDQASQISIDNNAENIFISAQTRITQMNASGQLQEKCDSLKGGDGNYISDMIVPVFSFDGDYDANNKYITKTGQSPYDEIGQTMLLTDFEIWDDYKEHNIIVLRAKSGDYDKYMTSPGTLSEGTRFLFELISESISDREVLNGAIALELAPDDAQVFSAFFSRNADELDYVQAATADDSSIGVVDISKRSYSNRHAKMLGYYGVNKLTHIDVKPPEELPLGELTLYNQDTLWAHLKFGTEVEDVNPLELKYTITVYDGLTSRPALILKLIDPILEKKSDIYNNLVKCNVTRLDSQQNTTAMGIYELPVYWEKISAEEDRKGLSFILDAADASAATTLLDKHNEAKKIRNGGIQDGDFYKTLSFFRFGTWADTSIACWTDYIYVEIEAEDNGNDASNLEAGGRAQSNTHSPYFEKEEYRWTDTEESNREYYKIVSIGNARHLYNVRYFEDYDIATLGLDFSEYNENTIYHFKRDYYLKDDIDWGAFANVADKTKSSYYATNSTYNGHTNHKSNSAEFPSFRELRSTDIFNGYDDNAAKLAPKDALGDPMMTENLQFAHKITGLQISKANNQVYEIYKNYADTQMLPTGLFIENKGTIAYLALDQVKVTGQYKVGSICGVNSGMLKYCGTVSTRSDDHPDPSIVSGVKYVGGVFGFSASKGTTAVGDVIYENLTNAARVKGQEYVGGITGWMATGNVQINDTLNAANNSAYIDKVGFKKCENTGQICGTLNGVSTFGKTMDERKSVRYIGGIVGYIKSGSSWDWDKYKQQDTIKSVIENCYSYPLYDLSYDKLNVGGSEISVVTAMENVVKISTHHELAKNAGNLNMIQQLNSGWYVGGIAGYAADVLIKDSGVRYTSATDDSGNVTYINKDAYGNKLASSGYIFGDRYVGGIVGFNAAYIDNCCNYASIYGNDNVGGVAGVVAEASETSGIPEPVVTVKLGGNKYSRTFRTSAANSINRGNVLAVYDNAGGITGLCYGSLEGSMNQNSDKSLNEISRISGRNYVGAVCGYFMGKWGMGESLNGDVENTGEREIYSYGSVDGENFVGGVCGYLRKDCAKPYQNVTFFGPVNASGSFVGGFIGLVTEQTLMYPGNDSIRQLGLVFYSNCTQLSGAYFVGGGLGAYIPADTAKDRYYNIIVNQPEMDIKATAYAGGAVGYIAIGKKDISTIESNIAKMAGLDILGDQLYIPEEKESRNEVRGIQTVTDMVSDTNQIDFGARSYKYTFRGFNDAAIKMIISVRNITPLHEDLVYASGLVGADSLNTNLKFTYFNKLKNCGAAFIKATYIMKTISLYNTETMKMETKSVPMAYSSKLTAINNEGCEITACYADGTYSSQGTYRGGLVEVNNGNIDLKTKEQDIPNDPYQPYRWNQDMDVAVDRVGGVCGKNNGTIWIRDMRHMTAAGRNIVGGVCGENGRTGEIYIEKSQNEGGVIATGSFAGGIAGCNYGLIRITQSAHDKRYVVYADSYAGGIIGEQVGNITLKNMNLKPSYLDDHDKPIEGYSGVKAENGVAGGLIGRITTLEHGFAHDNIDTIKKAAVLSNYTDSDEVILNNCNYGFQTPVEGKLCGGIVGEVVLGSDIPVTIDGCRVMFSSNYEVYINDKGTDPVVGGIVGKVQRVEGSGNLNINNCVVQAAVVNNSNRANSAGIIYDAGNVTNIDNCRVYSPEVGHGITATKAKSITNCFDASLKGKANFGQVIAGGTLKNNYCTENRNDSTNAAINKEPANYTDQDIYTVNYVKQYNKYFLYAFYDGKDDENNDAVCRFTMNINVNPGKDPELIDHFYHTRNSSGSVTENGYQNFWSAMDTGFSNIMNTTGRRY